MILPAFTKTAHQRKVNLCAAVHGRAGTWLGDGKGLF
jgi:hypothetical protein